VPIGRDRRRRLASRREQASAPHGSGRKVGKMKKLVALLAIGLGLCSGGRASAQDNRYAYPVIVQASATTTGSVAKAVADTSSACCKAKGSCNEPGPTKAACAPACSTGCTKGCCRGCLEKLRCWCFYRPLPCKTSCCNSCECSPHVWAFFPPGGCGCGYAGNGCAPGGCTGGMCAAGGCASGACGQGGGSSPR
jgi:hypothetical protein